MASVASKRKRDSQDMPGLRAPPAQHNDAPDFSQSYMSTDVEGLEHGDGNIDFSAMLQGADSAEAGTGLPPQAQQQTHRPLMESGEQTTASIPDPVQSSEQPPNQPAVAAMTQYHHTMTVPPSTEQAFMRDVPVSSEGDTEMETGQPGAQQTPTFPEFDPNASKDEDADEGNGEVSPSGGGRVTANGSKPAVGTEEWHKQRKDNHKEVERRRRETINEGINELSKIVPGCEKNKGQILSRAVSFITQLKENETQNIEKWTLEKLLAEQAIAELSTSVDRLKHDLQQAQSESDAWKRTAQNAGISLPDTFSNDAKPDGLAN